MTAMILGGNRFFGKKLATILLSKGYSVTLLNRGSSDDGFGEHVSRITCDRRDTSELMRLTKDQKWDFVFDQICYDYNTAKETCKVFDGKVEKYIFTSTQSVYEQKANLTESDFKPESYKMNREVSTTENYGEAKRQAEFAFHKFANFPYIAVRFPIVVGEDDYTGRFSFHVSRILKGEPIYFPNINAKISLISSDDAAKSLLHLAESNIKGAINVSSPKPIQLSHLVNQIEKETGKKAILLKEPSPPHHSPYGVDRDWFTNYDQRKRNNLELQEINDWLPEKITLLLKSC